MKIIESLLSVNPYSRPAKKLIGVKGIVIHWTGNPNTTAMANKNYFESLKSGKKGTYASAHYIICFDGSVVQCIPDHEMAYHVGSKTYTHHALSMLSSYPNNCTLGIECVVKDNFGSMTKETYDALVELCAGKLKEHGLAADALWLHKEVVGWKDCHRWFVNNPDQWVEFKQNVLEKMSAKPQHAEANDEEEETMKLELWQWKMIGDALDGMHKKGLISDHTWAEKAYKQEMTQSELLFVNTIIMSRQLDTQTSHPQN